MSGEIWMEITNFNLMKSGFRLGPLLPSENPKWIGKFCLFNLSLLCAPNFGEVKMSDEQVSKE